MNRRRALRAFAAALGSSAVAAVSTVAIVGLPEAKPEPYWEVPLRARDANGSRVALVEPGAAERDGLVARQATVRAEIEDRGWVGVEAGWDGGLVVRVPRGARETAPSVSLVVSGPTHRATVHALGPEAVEAEREFVLELPAPVEPARVFLTLRTVDFTDPDSMDVVALDPGSGLVLGARTTRVGLADRVDTEREERTERTVELRLPAGAVQLLVYDRRQSWCGTCGTYPSAYALQQFALDLAPGARRDLDVELRRGGWLAV
ncbi:MAG TPA: hypothetical protein VJP77_03165, partial [Planctomycetota bacterium]|nr:hypothetical protein [Planctomycetota bacterium]